MLCDGQGMKWTQRTKDQEAPSLGQPADIVNI